MLVVNHRSTGTSPVVAFAGRVPYRLGLKTTVESGG